MSKRTHLRWKREPAETGLAAIGAPPRGWTLHDSEQEYARVSPSGGGWQSKQRGWYWVAFHPVTRKNTCDTPVETPEQAKAEAMAYVKAELAKEPTDE